MLDDEDDKAAIFDKETSLLVGVRSCGANPKETKGLTASNTSCATTIQKQRMIGRWQVAIPRSRRSKDDSPLGTLF